MATTKGRKPARILDGAAVAPKSSSWTGPMRFEAYEENSGRHRWRLIASDGRDLATSSASFASHDDAQRAAAENRD
jgi:uncharacterized protein YegP (UPF0339 family)